MIQTNHWYIKFKLISFVCFSFSWNDVLELFQEASIIFSNVMTSTWVMATVIGWFPLMKVIFRGSVVIMMVVDSFSKFPVSKSDTSWQSTQIDEFNTVLLQNTNNFLCINIVFLQDFLFLKSWIIALVRNWSWVVVTVKWSVIHEIGNIFLIKFIIIQVYWNTFIFGNLKITMLNFLLSFNFLNQFISTSQSVD